VAVRNSSTFLMKSAALLLLGAFTVFACSVARALTFNWSVTTSLGGFGSGSFTTGDPSGTVYTLTGISGSWTIAGTADPIRALDSLGGATNKFNFSSNGSTLNVDIGGISFFTESGEKYNIYSGSSPGSYSPAVFFASDTGGFSSIAPDTSGSSINSPAPVPAPLPILGLPAVLFYARKLKARIKERKATAAVS